MKSAAIFAACLVAVTALRAAGPNPAPTSDDPMAGLNLGGAADGQPDSGKELSNYVAKLNHHLVVLDQGALVNFDAATLNGVQYWAIYHTAKWCTPRDEEFTPRLIEFYNSFKATHPNFVVILVSTDMSKDDMEVYMRNKKMPWPAIRFSDLKERSLQRFTYSEAPSLTLVDSNGKHLAEYHSSIYFDPGPALDSIKRIVPASDEKGGAHPTTLP